jgi:hypothetical protein
MPQSFLILAQLRLSYSFARICSFAEAAPKVRAGEARPSAIPDPNRCRFFNCSD